MSIKRPQKAPSESISDSNLTKIFKKYKYVLGSPKLDGYRIITNNAALTSSMKPLKNKYAQKILSAAHYQGFDGECVVGKPNDPDCFKYTRKALSTAEGKPDFKLYVFDTIYNKNFSYVERIRTIQDRCKFLPFAIWVVQTNLYSVAEVKLWEQRCIDLGFEGAMIRLPHAIYKEGRCTLREENIFKRKPMEEDEAIIIGFEEQMKNTNVKTVDATGRSTRSSHKANKIGKNTLGAIWLRSPKWKIDFKISGGKGITKNFRQWIWNTRSQHIGRQITYQYQKYGSIDAPRIPTFKAFTDLDTTTDY